MDHKVDIWDNLENDAYVNKHVFPVRPTKPKIALTASPIEFRNHADLLERYDEQMTAFRVELAHYHAISAALEAEFKSDLEAYHGTTDHPKRDLLYSKAWEHGHSVGLREVAVIYNDLVELVQ